MRWDPLSTWPKESRWIWLTIAGWVLVLRGPAFFDTLQLANPPRTLPDFFQEYAAARNWLDGRRIYEDHHDAAPRVVGVSLDDRRALVFVNAHPPTSVVVAIPFAKLAFADAFLTWNLVSLGALAASLWIVQRQLRIPISPWSAGPVVALVMLCFPLWEQCRLGQLKLILMLLVTGTWAAERSGRPWLAGILLGAAAAIKLFPAFLLVYYALRGRWRVVSAGILTVGALTALTAAVLGLDAYRDYFVKVLPAIQWFRVGWNNDSIWGFWSRLFDPAPEHLRDRSLTEPLYYSPTLATSLSLASCLALIGVLAWVVRGEATSRQDDLTFSLAATAMLLVSPICWEHYLLLLLVPLAVVWVELPPTRFARALFLVILLAFWLGYPLMWTAFDLNGRTAKPLHSLTVLSYQFYALLAFFALVLLELRHGQGRGGPFGPGPAGTLALGAVVMAMLWVHVFHSAVREYGLFYIPGGDFGIYRSAAEAFLGDGPRAMYDPELLAQHERALMAHYGPDAHGLNYGPWVYPPAFIVPFLAFASCPAVTGFVIWCVASLVLAFLVARGMAAGFLEGGGYGLIASCVLFFPVGFTVFFGQVAMLFAYGFYRGYRFFERGTDFRAGLWSGALYIKPQLAVFLGLVFLLKRRWRALAGLALAGLVVLGASLALVGADGLRDCTGTLRSMSGFRDVPAITSPSLMINWRGVLAGFLPPDVPDRMGMALTVALSLLTTASLLIVWRGAWDPGGARFPAQMLATVIVMMLASFHNHIHSAVILLVPGMAAAARAEAPPALRMILLAALYAPLPLFFATASTRMTAWLIVALMLAALGTILRTRFRRVGRHDGAGRQAENLTCSVRFSLRMQPITSRRNRATSA